MNKLSSLLCVLALVACVMPVQAAGKKSPSKVKNAKTAAAKSKAGSIVKEGNGRKPAATAKSDPAAPRTIASEVAKIEEMRGRLLIPEITQAKDDSQMMAQIQSLMLKNNPASNPWRPPGNAAGIPTGFGGGWTDLFAGGAISTPTIPGGKYDAAAFVGGSLGDPKKYVGVDLALGFYSIIPFARSGGVSARVTRQFPQTFGVAVGVENFYTWQDVNPATRYLVVSKGFTLDRDERKPFSSLFLHLGLGNSRYNSASNLVAGINNYNVFGGVGVRLFQPIGISASWTGNDLVGGVSITPFRRIPVYLNFGVSDVFTRVFTSVPRFSIAYSWADSWESDTFAFKAFQDL